MSGSLCSYKQHQSKLLAQFVFKVSVFRLEYAMLSRTGTT